MMTGTQKTPKKAREIWSLSNRPVPAGVSGGANRWLHWFVLYLLNRDWHFRQLLDPSAADSQPLSLSQLRSPAAGRSPIGRGGFFILAPRGCWEGERSHHRPVWLNPDRASEVSKMCCTVLRKINYIFSKTHAAHGTTPELFWLSWLKALRSQKSLKLLLFLFDMTKISVFVKRVHWLIQNCISNILKKLPH